MRIENKKGITSREKEEVKMKFLCKMIENLI